MVSMPACCWYWNEQAGLAIIFAFSQNLQVTPSVQWLHDPALNTGEDDVQVFGLRLRLSL